MVYIENSDISLTRGDTLALKIDILDENGEPYIPAPSDIIRFALKRRYKDKECLINKVIPNSSLVLQIEPEETKPLAFNKEYVYDIQLTTAGGVVDTFISGILNLTEEVD